MRANGKSPSTLVTLVVTIVTAASLALTPSCDTSTESEPDFSVGYFDGNHPCTTDADCPQYYKGCFDYVAQCQVASNRGKPLVGTCRCLDDLVFDEECSCEECDPKIDEEIDTGIKLCFLENNKSCESNDDCSGPGLDCWGEDPYGRCAPSEAGYLPCETDDDCLFGWQCFDRPKLSMFSCYYAEGDGSNGELLDTPVWSWPDDMCCAPRVCIPKGWLNVPDLFQCEGG